MSDQSNNNNSNLASKPLSLSRRLVQAVQYTIAGVTPQTWMSPLQPLPPMAEQAKGRLWDYPVAWNLNYIPRSLEPLSFNDLRNAAESGIIRTVIETRKDQMKGLEWIIKPREVIKGSRGKSKDYESQIDQVTDFFMHPNGMLDWQQFLGEMLEQHFVYDSLAIERIRNRGGNLAALKIMDGSTISVKLDQYGETPEPPSPAYQMILKGLPAIDFTTDELLYYPRNRRAGRAYGFPHVAQIIQHVDMSIKRVREQLAYYDHANRPHGVMTGGPTLTPLQVESLQRYWESQFSGNLEQRAKVWWVPNGTEYKPFTNEIMFDEFDEWLARVVCYCFSVSPTPFVKQNNRATAQSQQEQAAEEGLQPTMQYIKSVMDWILTHDLEAPYLEFSWVEDNEFDPSKKAVIDNLYARASIKSIDEIRDGLGLDPLGGAASKPMYATMNGWVPLDPEEGQQLQVAGAKLRQDTLGGPTPPGGAAPQQAQQRALPAPKKDADAAQSTKKPTGPNKDITAKYVASGINISRPVLNIDELNEWLASVGFTPASREFKVEIVDSVVPLVTGDWPEAEPVLLAEGGDRKVAYVDSQLTLSFESPELFSRFNELSNIGIGYGGMDTPCLVIDGTFSGALPTSIPPYGGPLLFGPEETSVPDLVKISSEEIDEAASETDTDPTEEQRNAGNYTKGKFTLYGLQISIENPRGSIREGHDPNGEEWRSKMPDHYGYIRGYIGADDGQIDVFVGNRPDSGRVFVIDQVTDKGDFDEHKCFLGFMGPKPVLKTFIEAYKPAEEDDPGEAHHHFGDMRELTIEEFKDWLEHGNLKEPIAEQNVGEEVPFKLHADKPKIVSKMSINAIDAESVVAVLRKDFNPDQPRDDHGKWTAEGDASAIKPLSTDYHHGTYLDEQGNVHTSNVNDAARALYEDRHVVLANSHQVATLLDKLHQAAQEAKAAGKDAPHINLCNVSVPGSNLFCADNKGIPRIKMPQLDDDQTKALRNELEKEGYTVEKTEEYASHLHATQNELDGVKVAGIMHHLEKDGMDPNAKRLIVSKDNYILDGHHHWAGVVGVDAAHHLGDLKMRVARVNIGITDLLQKAEKFSGEHHAMGKRGDDPLGDDSFWADVFDPDLVKTVTVSTGLTHYDQGTGNRRAPFQRGDDAREPDGALTFGTDTRQPVPFNSFYAQKIYNNVDELPQAVKDKIKSQRRREQWRQVWNSIFTSTKDESRAFAGAWSATQRAGGVTKVSDSRSLLY